MAIPEEVRKIVYERVWAEADSIGWNGLTITEKTEQYRNWALSDEVGGVLSKYMDVERVHPYIKDSIIKAYSRSTSLSINKALCLAGIKDSDNSPVEEYIKPFGVRLSDRNIILWGRAVDWKIVLLAMFERTYGNDYTPKCAILTNCFGKFDTKLFENLITTAAGKLGIESIVFYK